MHFFIDPQVIIKYVYNDRWVIINRGYEMPKIIDHEKRRAELAATAVAIFAQHGFEETAMRDIAEAAGVAKGSLYRYFKSKDDLLSYITQDLVAAFDRSTRETITSIDDPEEKLRRFVGEFVHVITLFPDLLRVYAEIWMYNIRGKYRDMKELFDDYLEQYRGEIALIIAYGQRAGVFRADIDPQHTAIGMMAFLDGIGLHSLYDKSGFDVQAVVDSFCATYCAGIRVPQEDTPA